MTLTRVSATPSSVREFYVSGVVGCQTLYCSTREVFVLDGESPVSLGTLFLALMVTMLQMGQEVQVRIANVNTDNNTVNLSMVPAGAFGGGGGGGGYGE